MKSTKGTGPLLLPTLSPTERRPLVSVVIATYNMGQYLREAIRSVLNQSVQDVEVIVVDDGSTDATADVMREFSSDTRVSYIYQENAGQTVAKNNGLSRCRGDFIGFCDGDDAWLPGRLDLQLAAFAQDAEVGVVYGALEQMDQNGVTLHPPEERTQHEGRLSGWITGPLFADNFVPFGTALVRRECFETLGCFDEELRMGIDWDLWLRFSMRYKFAYLRQPILRYRVWSGQMSKNWAGRYHFAFMIMAKFQRNFPGALTWRQVNHATAVTLVNRGRYRVEGGHQYLHGFADCIRALLRDPLYFKAYKSIGWILRRLVLRA